MYLTEPNFLAYWTNRLKAEAETISNKALKARYYKKLAELSRLKGAI